MHIACYVTEMNCMQHCKIKTNISVIPLKRIKLCRVYFLLEYAALRHSAINPI